MTSVSFNTQMSVTGTSETEHLDKSNETKARMPSSGTPGGLVDVIDHEKKRVWLAQTQQVRHYSVYYLLFTRVTTSQLVS